MCIQYIFKWTKRIYMYKLCNICKRCKHIAHCLQSDYCCIQSIGQPQSGPSENEVYFYSTISLTIIVRLKWSLSHWEVWSFCFTLIQRSFQSNNNYQRHHQLKMRSMKTSLRLSDINTNVYVELICFTVILIYIDSVDVDS